MRLAAPIFLLIALITNALTVALEAGRAIAVFYDASLAAQLIFYASALAGGYLLKRKRKVRLLNLAYDFSVMNAAALVGLVYFVLGKRNVWVKVKG